ncbi:MAG: hypothetical protein ACREOZ_03480 [Gloeomargaritales cyanobacterium]
MADSTCYSDSTDTSDSSDSSNSSDVLDASLNALDVQYGDADDDANKINE